MQFSRRRIFGLIIAIAVITVMAGALSFPALERHYMRQQAAQNAVPLKLAVEGLRAALERYAPLPALIAERSELTELLNDPGDQTVLAQVNEDLRQTAATVKASDVYLMDISGRTIAAATYLESGSYLGRNFNYQSYFTQALNGDLSSFSVYGTTSGERGYFYAAPVEDGERIVGVLAIKFNIAAFESIWRGADSEFMVTDRNDFVFMSSRPDWHFRAIRPLSDGTLRLIAQNLQYPIDRIDLLPMTATPLNADAQQVDIQGTPDERFVRTSQRLTDLDWTMSALSPRRPATLNALNTLLIAGLTAGLVLAALLAYLLKQAGLAEAFAKEQDAKRRLETAVTERTADLQTALADLKQTQTDLIQAGKLSALGQMSAALSHEFNQPLAAVKSYADNATAFLDRDRMSEARDNILRISKMADRMATISAHLRNFARKPQQATGPLLLNAVIHDAIAVVDVRLAAEGGAIAYNPPKTDIWINGGHVRLQQVIVNLINNALDAMEDEPDRIVRIEVEGTTLRVRDTGSGIADKQVAHIFDPFFTTKAPGKGLGLGLSISYNIVSDFGGTLSAENHPGGGAVFTVRLQPAKPIEVAAQ
ncbi:two-component system C4-dicarboxylate transport sensor histidine kinase DctB [Yoonia maricola]|uniref:C4-dicarboxylate transport sensor protein DctB n=1 Tax=Yoonia maricola TaxID=420999 RepID=A0A2M8WLT3_9RHOB|nr:ATP-binding protein [Yoonia maricola]PJI91887.1 two-component system C4-dicarboxylate transport sensor histidine kinase DctB [Yoonia maricola]